MYHMICSCCEDTNNPYAAHNTLINDTVIVDDGPIEAEGYDIGEEPKATIIDVLANDKARPASSGPLFVAGFEDVSRRALSDRLELGKGDGKAEEAIDMPYFLSPPTFSPTRSPIATPATPFPTFSRATDAPKIDPDAPTTSPVP